MGRRTYTYLLFIFTLTTNASTANGKITTVPPVVISAGSSKHIYSGSSGPVTRITRQQLMTSGNNTLSQALQNLGGVQLQDMSGNGSQVSMTMRGFGANAMSNTLLLINGIPVTNPDLAPPDLNVIPLQEIEYIEITEGTESVLYGDQAVGGIVNIITRDQIKERAEFNCGAGSYNAHRCYVMLNHSSEATNYNMFLNNYHSDNYREHNDYDQNRLLGNLAYQYQAGRIRLNYNVANEYMQYPGALTAQQVRKDRRQSTNNTDFFKNWNGYLHVMQKQNLNENWRVETDYTHRFMQGNGVLFAPFRQSRTTDYIKPQIKGAWQNAILSSGLDIQYDQYHLNSLIGTSRDSQQKYGVFAIAAYPVNTQLTVTLGARGEMQHTQLRSFISDNYINRAEATTIGSAYQISPDISLYLRRAESFRFPKADENASAFKPLRTQRGTAWETGAETKRTKYSAKIGVYQLNLKDEIAFDPTQTPLTPFGTNRNLSPTIRRGISISGEYNITEQLAMDGQYNYVNAVFSSGIYRNKRIPLVSENILRADINYKLAEHWKLYTEAVLTGNQYADNDNMNIAGKIGAYTVYNFNALFEYQSISLSFRVNNIFNKNYYIYTVYQPMMNTEFFYPAPDRNFMLTLNYSLS